MPLTITAKGQLTLRKEFLQHLGVSAGEKVDIEKMPNGTLRVVPSRQTGSIEDFFGSLKGKPRRVKHLTTEQINHVIARGWAGELEEQNEGDAGHKRARQVRSARRSAAVARSEKSAA